MLDRVMAGAVEDLSRAFDVLKGAGVVPVVEGLSEAEVRRELALEAIAIVGKTMTAALNVVGRANAMLSMMVAPEGPVAVEVEDEEKGPYGFGAYHKARMERLSSKERAAKAA